jgi:preprotein translocase subunit SecF
VITHVTVTLALLALLLFGGASIHSFTAAMTFGAVLVGSYTSIFIASPMLIYLGVSQHRGQATATDVEEAGPARTEAKPAPAGR